ncbi:MAG: protein of unknown function DUF755 [Anelloviridae sp.]|nr:MAG: protein of unknown function DUF755 [Anelloviridae sp.]
MLHQLTSLTQIRYRVQRSQLKPPYTNLTGDETKLQKQLQTESLKTTQLQHLYLQMQSALERKSHSTKHSKKNSCHRRRRKPKRRHYSTSSSDSDTSKKTFESESSSS